MANNASLVQPRSGSCTVCGKSTGLSCSSCRGSPSYADMAQRLAVHYSGQSCQKKDRKQHRGICSKLRIGKKIERAANIINKAWLAHRERAFDLDVYKVEDKGDVIHVYEHDEYDGAKPRRSTLLWDFPADLVITEDLKRAVLNSQACTSVLSGMLWLIKPLLQEICKGRDTTNISEVDHFIRKPARYIKGFHSKGEWTNMEDCHTVLDVTTTTDERWTLDFSGAQYGQDHILLPTHIYTAKFMAQYPPPISQVFGKCDDSERTGHRDAGTRILLDIYASRVAAYGFREGFMTCLKYLDISLVDLLDFPVERLEQLYAQVILISALHYQAIDLDAFHKRFRLDVDPVTGGGRLVTSKLDYEMFQRMEVEGEATFEANCKNMVDRARGRSALLACQ